MWKLNETHTEQIISVTRMIFMRLLSLCVRLNVFNAQYNHDIQPKADLKIFIQIKLMCAFCNLLSFIYTSTFQLNLTSWAFDFFFLNGQIGFDSGRRGAVTYCSMHSGLCQPADGEITLTEAPPFRNHTKFYKRFCNNIRSSESLCVSEVRPTFGGSHKNISSQTQLHREIIFDQILYSINHKAIFDHLSYVNV